MDKGYYKFKDAIKSKEDIAKHADKLDAGAITQIEHLWDKYKVTLKDVEAEYAEADKVMKKYLKELGYE